MGALTFKPSAYTTRPWELTSVVVPDYYDFGAPLTFHVRGSKLMRISSVGWLRDRIRFSYDGFRRQRVVQPLSAGKVVSWPTALQLWFVRACGGTPSFYFSPGETRSAWLHKVACLVSQTGGSSYTYVFDLNRVSQLFQGPFGLQSVVNAFLVLPTKTAYEEENFLVGPAGPVGLFDFALILPQLFEEDLQFLWSGLNNLQLTTTTSYRVSRSVFQVSPLQRLLSSVTG